LKIIQYLTLLFIQMYQQLQLRPSRIGNGSNRKAGTPSTKILSGLSFILQNS